MLFIRIGVHAHNWNVMLYTFIYYHIDVACSVCNYFRTMTQYTYVQDPASY